MMGEFFEYLANTEVKGDAGGIILAVGMILGFTLLIIFMIIGFRKCLLFGKQIGHSVISFNIVLFGAPMILFAIMVSVGRLNVIPLYLWIVIVAVCWGIAIMWDVIVCGKHIGYTLAYIFFQFMMGFLMAGIVFSIVSVFVLAVVVIVCAMSVHSDVYDIDLVSRESGNHIRARKDSYSGVQVLNGEHGERFEYVGDGDYRLVSTCELYYVN